MDLPVAAQELVLYFDLSTMILSIAYRSSSKAFLSHYSKRALSGCIETRPQSKHAKMVAARDFTSKLTESPGGVLIVRRRGYGCTS